MIRLPILCYINLNGEKLWRLAIYVLFKVKDINWALYSSQSTSSFYQHIWGENSGPVELNDKFGVNSEVRIPSSFFYIHVSPCIPLEPYKTGLLNTVSLTTKPLQKMLLCRLSLMINDYINWERCASLLNGDFLLPCPQFTWMWIGPFNCDSRVLTLRSAFIWEPPQKESTMWLVFKFRVLIWVQLCPASMPNHNRPLQPYTWKYLLQGEL